MRDTNSVVLGGNLVADPETKTINGADCVSFRLACNNTLVETNKDNTTYIDCEWWNPNGALKHLEKGKKVEVCGKILGSHWKDKETGANRSKNYIKVHELNLRSSNRTNHSEETKEEEELSVPF
jgi:single-strand DNA-binding protein